MTEDREAQSIVSVPYRLGFVLRLRVAEVIGGPDKLFLSPIGWGSSCGPVQQVVKLHGQVSFCPLSVGVRPAAILAAEKQAANADVSVPYRLGFVLRQ